jgi:hypothetical protein
MERTAPKRGTTKYDHRFSLHTNDTALFFNVEAILNVMPAVSMNFSLISSAPEQRHQRLRKCIFHHPGDTTLMQVPRAWNLQFNLENPVGFIEFTTEFKYIGSIVHHPLTSDADVDKRIKSASAAFGVLKSILTIKDIDLKVKRRL